MPRNKLSDPEKIARQTIAENLRKFTHGMTQAELSAKTGIPKSTLSGYFAQRSTPNAGTLEKIADALNISKSDIDPRYDLTLPSNIIDIDHSQLNSIRIPIVGEIACGTPITAEQNIEGYHYVNLKHVPAGKMFGLRCKGDSMEPLIPNGAIVTVLQQPSVETDEIAAVMINGEATLKRFKELSKGHIVLYPINTKYEPIFLDGEEDVKIIGKAIHFDGEL
ncbi:MULTISPECIES: LexA family protein [Lactobacillus]|uniref:LexA family protein n=1 Tax=Lactobacillus TaxID=1578 RepID=UPI001C6A7B2D|nr:MULTISPECIES: XRE family transcriptional regulator [Lactobacillus]MCX8721395.1 helix-turn-helix domain-containing protein [Lactobacillus sp. B4010]MCX8732388.1 helix-turn-helix domain-containing protein [Lactobacillus sp. B4015]MCX8734418.1 helix-turn-helix domain-containing protein [Lactobacillus sp. B4012]QYN56387.1 helix-turn-helix domain-containing protein [Lactobacillus panisapium]